MHTLLKGLEKIAASADIPMLVCGDFNSVPGRLDCFFFLCLIFDTFCYCEGFISISNLFVRLILTLL